MSKLLDLSRNMARDEVLFPILRAFLAEQERLQKLGKLSRRDVTITDAEMTIACMQQRIAEFNHGEPQGMEYFHPSAIGKCLRAIWFARMGAPIQAVGDSSDFLRRYMTFETGTYIHVLFQNLCERAGVLLRREIPIVSDEDRIIGHGDGELQLPKNKSLLEIKTMNSTWFSKLTTPESGHIWQSHAYMKALKLPEAAIVYLEKDRHQAKEFRIPFEQKIYTRFVKGRIDYYFDCVDSREAPDQEGAGPSTFPCRFCEYRRVCFDSKEFASFTDKVKANENQEKSPVNKPAPKIKLRLPGSKIKLRLKP